MIILLNQGNHHLHWQKGMFLITGPHGKPCLKNAGANFMSMLRRNGPNIYERAATHSCKNSSTITGPAWKDRYRFMVPCPEIIDGQPCKGRFNIHTLRQFLAEGDSTIRCQECAKKQSIAELLLGFEERDMSVQLREIKEQLAGLDSRIANYFMATMHAIADEAKDGPRLFTFRSRDAGFHRNKSSPVPFLCNYGAKPKAVNIPSLKMAKVCIQLISHMNGSCKLRRMQIPFRNP
jgi:hypothetical protein